MKVSSRRPATNGLPALRYDKSALTLTLVFPLSHTEREGIIRC